MATTLQDRPRLPGFREVAHQAYRDWFGKDVQETPTVSYVWTADQFGHFGLGFQITYLLGWIAIWLGHPGERTLVALAALNLLVWVVKEVFDYFREVKNAKNARSIFPFNGREVAWNAFTAVFYIATGVFVAGSAIFIRERPLLPILMFVILLIPTVVLGVWWLRRKITFQQAGLPYLYRLANFPNDVGGRPMVEFIEHMIDPSSRPHRHLVISGPLGAGKSSLAVGIGTEFAFRMGIGRYTTLPKLLQMIEKQAVGCDKSPTQKPSDIREFQDGRILWPWKTADLLIVDDVDAVKNLGGPIAAASLDVHPTPAEQVETVIEARLGGFLERIDIKDRRTVWVVSDETPAAAWRAMLTRVLKLTNAEDLAVIELTETVGQHLAGAAPTGVREDRRVPANV